LSGRLSLPSKSLNVIIAQSLKARFRIDLGGRKVEVSQKLLHLINRDKPRIQQDSRDGMPEEVWIHAFCDASGAGARRDNGLDRPCGITRMPVALKQKSPLTPLEMGTQFVRQCWQDRYIAIRPPFCMDEVYLRWVVIQQQIFDTDVHEFIVCFR